MRLTHRALTNSSFRRSTTRGPVHSGVRPGNYRNGGTPAILSGVFLDEIARNQFVAESIVVKVSFDEQVAQEAWVISFVSEHRREVIEKAPALVLAPIAPDCDLARLLVVVEQLLGPWIDSDRQRNVAFGKQSVKGADQTIKARLCIIGHQLSCPEGSPRLPRTEL